MLSLQQSQRKTHAEATEIDCNRLQHILDRVGPPWAAFGAKWIHRRAYLYDNPPRGALCCPQHSKLKLNRGCRMRAVPIAHEMKQDRIHSNRWPCTSIQCTLPRCAGTDAKVFSAFYTLYTAVLMRFSGVLAFLFVGRQIYAP